jgi:DnaK suppressor protein
MRKQQLDIIRKQLLDLREQRLLECRRRNAEAAALLDEGVADDADQGLTDSLKNFLHLISDAKREEIMQIDEALERLANGTYGRCPDCGRAIDIDRLAIHPFTRLCLGCQRKTEQIETARAGPDKGRL